MHKLTSGALVVALTGTAVTVPATINPTAHYAEAQGLLGLGGQALQGLVEKGEAKVAELESQLWKADLALKGAQALMEMKRWGVVLAIGEENKKAKQAEYDQQKLLVDSAELLVRTTKTSLDAARKTLAVTKKQLEDFNGKDPSAYEDAPEPDTKPLTLPTNLREALESITAQQEAVAKRQALFDEADSAYTKRKKEVDSSWFSWLAPSNTKELEGLKNRRDARKAKLDLEQARLDNITRSIELFEAVEAETPAYEGHGADRYDATTPTDVDDASRQLEFANSTLEAATHRKANIEANLAALTGWQERNPFTGFWHNADKWTLERALRAADNEIADATKRIADKAAALEALKEEAVAPTEPSEVVEPSAEPSMAAEPTEASEVVEPSEALEPSAEPTEASAARTTEPSESAAAPEASEPAAEPTTELSAATSTPATTSTPTSEESAPRTPEASENVEPADTSAEPEDQIDIDELTQNLDEAKKLEQDMLDLQKLLQQYINKPETAEPTESTQAEASEPSEAEAPEAEVSPTTVTEVSAATAAPATTAVPTSSEVSAARTTEVPEPSTKQTTAAPAPAISTTPTSSEQSAARTTEVPGPSTKPSAATSVPATKPRGSAPRTTTSAKLSTVTVVPATSSKVSAPRTTETAKPSTKASAATSTPATTTAPASSEVSAARTTEVPEPSTKQSVATSAPATTATPASPEVSAARTTEVPEPSAKQSAATSVPATKPGSSAPRTTEQAPETTQQQENPTQQAEGSSTSSWLWLIVPLLLALGFGGAAYADLIPGVRLPKL
ncbi:hypothetical protein KBX29_10155 [Corynebacterium sp. CCUG 18816]|uniref:hypothetical protein n=1 Tax=Corynebacterium pseudogenitalium TaxID=38303 RepID=UPI00210971F7|nr:hypothetical protein [Corynebacterium pseudogenitalium]MCQ4617185.1 hypothetical protein [Corynebacterium pseudogenitalium]